MLNKILLGIVIAVLGTHISISLQYEDKFLVGYFTGATVAFIICRGDE